VSRRPEYPPAERLSLVETLHGHRVADPYRWLEDADDPRVKEWSAAQDALARDHLDALPGRDRLRTRLAALLAAGSVGPPTWRGARAFFSRREPGQEHAALLVRDPDGRERTLVDPGALDPTGATTLDAWSPSIEGDLLAYQLSSGGDEESSLHVLDVTTGGDVDAPVPRTRYSPVAWLPGGQELYYVRRLPPEDVPAGETQLHRRVYRHRLGTDPDTDVLVHGQGLDKTNYYGVRTSRDGRWLVVSASPGTAPRDDVWIADLAGDGVLREVQVGVDARCEAEVDVDGRLYLRTDRDAPRGRLCVADPARPSYEHWRTLVGEDPDSVLDDTVLLDGPDGPLLAVARTHHAVAEVHLHDRESGAARAALDLPGLGSLTGLTRRPEGGPELWLGYTDHVTPPHVHHYDARTGRLSLAERAPGAVEVPAVRTSQLSYPSADGTTVRMFVLAADAAPTAPRPTVLYGYGGFDIALTPAYSAGMLAWVEAGGVYAVANLRGGSEEGQAWHRAGMREHKQNVFDDFAAAAEHLVSTGWTTPEQLGIAGGSNGGLLVGAVLTQRPELCAAVVCSAPLLDMIRYERFGLGVTWNDEYGTAEDPVELGWLLGYSPYHAVSGGVPYPGVLFTVFDSDTRVDPLHARKMCAALQAATSSGRPVLLRREADVGHGARSIRRTVDLGVDTAAFLAAQTGLAP